MNDFSAAQVGLLQNATFTQDGEIKGIPVAGTLTDEDAGDNSNMLTITGDDGLVYQVRDCFHSAVLIHAVEIVLFRMTTFV